MIAQFKTTQAYLGRVLAQLGPLTRLVHAPTGERITSANVAQHVPQDVLGKTVRIMICSPSTGRIYPQSGDVGPLFLMQTQLDEIVSKEQGLPECLVCGSRHRAYDVSTIQF